MVEGFLASSPLSRLPENALHLRLRISTQMGCHARGQSHAVSGARCIYITKAAGVAGAANGSISCIGVLEICTVPSGIRAVLAGKPTFTLRWIWNAPPVTTEPSPAPILVVPRACAMQFLPGTDFISTPVIPRLPNYDNMFAGSSEDAEDFDDNTLSQRDTKVDGGLRPVREEDVNRHP